MPYGLPWGTEAFICPDCKEASWRPLPYCPNCGSKQDPREVFRPRAARRAVLEFDAIRTALDGLRGHSVRLWDYCVSHGELTLRVAHSEASELVRSENTLVMCAATTYIKAPTDGWHADLSLDQFEGQYGPLYRLTDEKAGVYVECRFICLYEHMPAHYFGAVLRD